MPRVMCVWIPDWPLQRLAVERADLHGRTVVLYEASPQGGLKVVAATAKLGTVDFAAAGIYPGMPLAEAAALVAAQRSAEATSLEPHLEPADPEADRLALEQLAEWCGRFSPIAGVEDAPRPDCLLLDVTGLASLFGGERALVEEVVRAFAERGLNVCVAVADTIGAAWAAVHVLAPGSAGGQCCLGRCPLNPPAELGAKCAEPGARRNILHPGQTLSALAPLPIGYLRVAEETVALLATLGITRIGQLTALPRSALLARFGPELLRRFDQAIGGAPETIVARHAPPEYAADFTFEAPIANREAIEHILRQLIARVVEPLARRREGVLRLVCRFKYEHAFEEDRPGGPTQAIRNVPVLRTSSNVSNGMPPPLRVGLLPAGPPGLNSPGRISSLVFTVGLFRPSASPEYLRDLLRLRLENVRMAGPVTSVHVEVTSVGPLELRQQALFDSETNQEQPRRLAGLVDRLSNRLGRAAVVQVALLPDAQPEYTCVDVPLAGSSPPLAPDSAHLAPSSAGGFKGHRPRQHCPPAKPGAKGKSAKKNLAHVSRYGLLSFAADERPLWLLPQPARIEVVAAPHGAAAQFRWAGRSYAVACVWGPERIETGWWRTAQQERASRKTFVRRDYYRVETISGARFWIFRSLADRQWFLHGTFD